MNQTISDRQFLRKNSEIKSKILKGITTTSVMKNFAQTVKIKQNQINNWIYAYRV